MSRIGSRIIQIPSDVTASLEDQELVVTGPKGTLTVPVHTRTSVLLTTDTIQVMRNGNDKFARSLHGLTRVLIMNAIHGVKEGFTKRLEMHGIGYRAQTDGKQLTVNVGFNHPVVIKAPEGVNFNVEKNTLITIQGINKQVVGQVAADIREVRKPEPYKGKGIRYAGEYVRRKAGKAAKAGK